MELRGHTFKCESKQCLCTRDLVRSGSSSVFPIIRLWRFIGCPSTARRESAAESGGGIIERARNYRELARLMRSKSRFLFDIQKIISVTELARRDAALYPRVAEDEKDTRKGEKECRQFARLLALGHRDMGMCAVNNIRHQ